MLAPFKNWPCFNTGSTECWRITKVGDKSFCHGKRLSCTASSWSHSKSGWPHPFGNHLCIIYYVLHTIVSQKSARGWSTLHKSAKEGVGALLSVAHLTTKECSCHVYSDSMPLKQITRQTIMYKGTTSGFRVKGTATLWMAPCHREHGVAHSVHQIRLYMQSCLVFSEV